MSELAGLERASAAELPPHIFTADDETVKSLGLALRFAMAFRPTETDGMDGVSLYTTALEIHIMALNDLVESFRGELAAKDDLLSAKDGVIDALREGLAESCQARLATSQEAMENIRRVGIHFREIADTARNIQAALRENDPRDAAEPAIDALQAIIGAGDQFADAIAESAYTAIAHQLTDSTDEPATETTEGEETA